MDEPQPRFHHSDLSSEKKRKIEVSWVSQCFFLGRMDGGENFHIFFNVKNMILTHIIKDFCAKKLS